MAARTKEAVALLAEGALFDTKDDVNGALVRYVLATGRQLFVVR
jgi:hypothetical protein